MGKVINNVINPFFEIEGKEGDIFYSFTGNCGISSENVLYGKTINLSEMYDKMLGDVREFLFGGEFVNSSEYESSGRKKIAKGVNSYTYEKYGITLENVYNKVKGYSTYNNITTDIIFNELKVKYGIRGVDWMYLYDSINFYTNDVEILEYIGNRLLDTEIYNYFVMEYKLRTVGVLRKKEMMNLMGNSDRYYIKMEWNGGGIKNIRLSDFVRSYNRWWVMMTGGDKKRVDIRDYELLIEGRRLTEVFPMYCPVYSNLRLNYTGIDFDNGKKNIKRCSEVAGYSERGETWSFASIDRIDSSKGYSYDNIRIISQYANQLKNVGSIDQLRMLLKYMDDNHGYF